jgi:hypothetical protein
MGDCWRIPQTRHSLKGGATWPNRLPDFDRKSPSRSALTSCGIL